LDSSLYCEYLRVFFAFFPPAYFGQPNAGPKPGRPPVPTEDHTIKPDLPLNRHSEIMFDPICPSNEFD